jgi:tetratricopeptide (TPR) repeat protein
MKRILFVILFVILLAFPSAAHADIAPPAQPPGSNLQPGDEATQVRMLSETVLIEVQAGAPAKSLGQAHVTADFTMRNLGQAVESMAVRFPISASDGWFNFNELRDLQVKVDDRSVSTRRISGEDPYGSSSEVPWAEFDVDFPAGSDVQVEVRYTLEASGEYPFVWFKYILASGAGWKDSIGSADIIVRLPYAANNQNVLLEDDEGYFGTTRGGSISENEIRWHYEDLEPEVPDNFEINLVMPSAWEQVLTEQENVGKNPKDGEAWGRLGKLYKEMAFSSRGKGFRMETSSLDAGAEELYRNSLQAYEKAVSLKPADGLWHAGYADLLAYHAYFEVFNGENTTVETVHSLREIHEALELAPNDPKVQEIADEISFMFPNGMQRNGDTFEFPWLTATPPAPTSAAVNNTATESPPPTATREIEITSTTSPAETPVPSPALPVCSSAVVIPMLGICFARLGRRKKYPAR